MEETNTNVKEIVAKVHSFCDDVIDGKVDAGVVDSYQIPHAYIDVCREQGHPSRKKLQQRLFEYVMMRIGYYDNIANQEAIAEIADNIDNLLLHPKDDEKYKPLYMPKFLYGVKETLDAVEHLNNASQIDFAKKSQVENVQFGKNDRCFQLSYSKDPRVSVSLEDFSTPRTTLQIENQNVVVPEGGGHVSSHISSLGFKDDLIIQIDKFHHTVLQDDKRYYFRYITEINTKQELLRTFIVDNYDIDGIDTFTIDTVVDGKQLLLYFYTFKQKRYLIIEYNIAVTVKEMNDVCFSTLVAFGMITSNVHLNECWLAAYDSIDRIKGVGLYFQSLVPSIRCDYQIFTTNVYPSLVHVAKRIDPTRGERRACGIIGNLKLSNALPEFPKEVFGKLVENMMKYEELQRGIFIVLMGSKLHLEIQAATYCVALEAISNLAPKIISQKEEHIINDKKAWKQVKKRFNALTEELCKQQIISEDEKKSIKTKIENMNKAFNSEKLRALLVFYNYPIRQFDELTLMLRNLLLHGNIKFKVLNGRQPEDYLFELSMNLHKLCCAIALLMSGYKGYIVNNRKLYDYPNSYKAFIRIGDNTRVEYPEYKEKKESVWGRICKIAKGILWQ